MKRIKYSYYILTLFFIVAPRAAFGDTMSSSSFIITSDDLSSGGGYSSSASYKSESDIGGVATGENLSSDSFIACAGYPCTLTSEDLIISFSISSNVVNLGILSPSQVSYDSTVLTTTITQGNGYSVTAYADGNFRDVSGNYVSGVSDGTVTVGNDEYGIALTGVDRAFSDERALSTSPLTVAENTGPVIGSDVTVDFKASVSTSVPSGSYAQITTFICAGSF